MKQNLEIGEKRWCYLRAAVFLRPRSWLACHFKYDFVVVSDSCVLFKCVLIFIYAGSACSYHCVRCKNSVSTCL